MRSFVAIRRDQMLYHATLRDILAKISLMIDGLALRSVHVESISAAENRTRCRGRCAFLRLSLNSSILSGLGISHRIVQKNKRACSPAFSSPRLMNVISGKADDDIRAPKT